jgi:aryl-alcohol dehydrogenase-like predicted oxidoreductase
VGRALKDFADRDAVVIATKIRHPMRQGPHGAGLSRKAIFAEIDHSLRRLGTDYVDLYRYERYLRAERIAGYLARQLIDAGADRHAQTLRSWAADPLAMFAQSWVSATATRSGSGS